MNICIFGDSITWGACDYEKGGWAERLKTYLMESKEDVDVYNLGISGNNTQDLLKRFEVEAAAREAEEDEIIIFAIGLNDSQYLETKDNPCIGLKEFEKNILSLIENARKITSKIVFIGLTRVDESKVMPIPWDTLKFYENKAIQRYDSVLKKVCQSNNLLFISLFEVLDNQDLEDGLHPNSNGHRKIFEEVKENLEPLLI